MPGAATRHFALAERESLLPEILVHPFVPPVLVHNRFAGWTANLLKIFSAIDELQISRYGSRYFVSLGRYFPKIRDRLLLPGLHRHKPSLLGNDMNVIVRHRFS